MITRHPLQHGYLFPKSSLSCFQHEETRSALQFRFFGPYSTSPLSPPHAFSHEVCIFTNHPALCWLSTTLWSWGGAAAHGFSLTAPTSTDQLPAGEFSPQDLKIQFWNDDQVEKKISLPLLMEWKSRKELLAELVYHLLPEPWGRGVGGLKLQPTSSRLFGAVHRHAEISWTGFRMGDF